MWLSITSGVSPARLPWSSTRSLDWRYAGLNTGESRMRRTTSRARQTSPKLARPRTSSVTSGDSTFAELVSNVETEPNVPWRTLSSTLMNRIRRVVQRGDDTEVLRILGWVAQGKLPASTLLPILELASQPMRLRAAALWISGLLPSEPSPDHRLGVEATVTVIRDLLDLAAPVGPLLRASECALLERVDLVAVAEALLREGAGVPRALAECFLGLRAPPDRVRQAVLRIYLAGLAVRAGDRPWAEQLAKEAGVPGASADSGWKAARDAVIHAVPEARSILEHLECPASTRLMRALHDELGWCVVDFEHARLVEADSEDLGLVVGLPRASPRQVEEAVAALRQADVAVGRATPKSPSWSSGTIDCWVAFDPSSRCGFLRLFDHATGEEQTAVQEGRSAAAIARAAVREYADGCGGRGWTFSVDLTAPGRHAATPARRGASRSDSRQPKAGKTKGRAPKTMAKRPAKR